MDKRKNKIILWLLTWAGLLLVVVYSPIGSPDLYKPQVYYYQNQGVNFNGAIENAPRVGNISSNDNNDISIPTYTAPRKNYSTYSVDAPKRGSSNGIVAMGGVSGRSSVTKQNNTSGNGGGFGGSSFSSSRKKTDNNVTSQIGINTFSTDLSLNGDSTTKQSVDYTPGSGATDPGEDPEGPPIPVGDGYWFLSLLAIGYLIWKTKIFR
ncbi:MAG: hypothetical protein ACOYMD_15530 [Paludibacter sp.]